MISLPLPLQIPLFIIVVGILLCLMFEAAGVPEGYRRHGSKNYLSLIAVLIVIAVFFQALGTTPSLEYQHVGGIVFDRLSRSAILSLSILVLLILWIIAERLKPSNTDRGEIYALVLFSYFTSIVICCAHDFLLISTVLIAWPFTQIGILAIRKKRDASPEVALKLIMFAAFALFLLATIFIFLDLHETTKPSFAPSQYAAIAVIFSLALLLMGNIPVQSMRVDILDGAPSYSAAFAMSATLISCSIILIRLIDRFTIPKELYEKGIWVFIFFGALSLCLAPILALDQARLRRLLAYLLSTQSGLALLAVSLSLHKTLIPDYFYGLLFTHFTLCAAGSYAGINFWKNAKGTFKTWEDFAGAGREQPFAAAAFFIVLASLAGLPLTSGFVLKNAIINFTPASYRLPILLIVLASIILTAIPIFRLFAFFFGKTTRHEIRKHHHQRQFLLLIVCAFGLSFIAVAPESILHSIFG